MSLTVAPQPLNLCALCRQDFSSVKLFDAHIVGKPSDRRRGCLSIEEMRSKGWEPDARGRWCDPIEVERARARFGGGAGMPLSRAGVRAEALERESA